MDFPGRHTQEPARCAMWLRLCGEESAGPDGGTGRESAGTERGSGQEDSENAGSRPEVPLP